MGRPGAAAAGAAFLAEGGRHGSSARATWRSACSASLQVDITHTCDTLGWTPPISVDEGLRRAAAGMVQRR